MKQTHAVEQTKASPVVPTMNGVTDDETVIELTLEQQNNVIKNHKFNEFLEKYQSLSACINALPLDAGIKSGVIWEFDTGFLWVKEAFSIMQFVKPKAAIIDTTTNGN